MDQQSLPPSIDETILPSSTLALISLISALLGFTFVPVIGGIVAIVTGYMAKQETRAVPPRASGDSMATAGIILGWVQIALLVIGICCAVIFFVFIVGLVASSNR